MTETIISIDDLLNLPRPSAKEMGWSPKSIPTIAVLCKDDKDTIRLWEKYNDLGNNPFVYVKYKSDLVGHNIIAILVSKDFDDEEILDYAKERIISRCSHHDEFKKLFIAKE